MEGATSYLLGLCRKCSSSEGHEVGSCLQCLPRGFQLQSGWQTAKKADKCTQTCASLHEYITIQVLSADSPCAAQTTWPCNNFLCSLPFQSTCFVVILLCSLSCPWCFTKELFDTVCRGCSTLPSLHGVLSLFQMGNQVKVQHPLLSSAA